MTVALVPETATASSASASNEMVSVGRGESVLVEQTAINFDAALAALPRDVSPLVEADELPIGNSPFGV